MQWDVVADGAMEIMGQRLDKESKYPASWILVSDLYNNKETFKINYTNPNSDLNNSSVSLSRFDTNKKLFVIGLQIQSNSVVFVDPVGDVITRPFEPLDASDDAEGLSIEGNQYVYEVRIYSLKSLSEKDMKSVWQEMNAVHNTT